MIQQVIQLAAGSFAPIGPQCSKRRIPLPGTRRAACYRCASRRKAPCWRPRARLPA